MGQRRAETQDTSTTACAELPPRLLSLMLRAMSLHSRRCACSCEHRLLASGVQLSACGHGLRVKRMDAALRRNVTYT